MIGLTRCYKTAVFLHLFFFKFNNQHRGYYFESILREIDLCDVIHDFASRKARKFAM